MIETFYAGATTFQLTKGLLKREYYDGLYQAPRSERQMGQGDGTREEARIVSLGTGSFASLLIELSQYCITWSSGWPS